MGTPGEQIGMLHQELGSVARLKEDVPSDRITTFSIGGPAALVVEPVGISGLETTLRVLSKRDILWRIIGAGSNILLPDSGVSDVVIHLGREFSGFSLLESAGITIEQAASLLDPQSGLALASAGGSFEAPDDNAPPETISIFAGGGTPLMNLSRKLSQQGLSGLEFAAGIPGSLGGAVKMNAGAHGHSMSEIVTQAFVVTDQGELGSFSNRELDFSYRYTAIANDMIVVGAELRLTPKSKEEVLEERSRCLEYRKKTQPLHLPSAGSVFRNPTQAEASRASMGKVSYEKPPAAAWLIEQVGLKGERRGGVSFSEMHANWLVKVDDSARAEDVVELISEAQKRVEEEFSITLVPEIVLW